MEFACFVVLLSPPPFQVLIYCYFHFALGHCTLSYASFCVLLCHPVERAFAFLSQLIKLFTCSWAINFRLYAVFFASRE